MPEAKKYQVTPFDYLVQYFTSLSRENRWLMTRLEGLYRRFKPQGTMVELGGGPTIYQLISAALYVDRIIFTDWNPDNLAEVTRWMTRDRMAFDWAEYFAVAARTTGLSAVELEDLLRLRISEVRLLNILDLANSGIEKTHGVVSSLFCLEAAVSSHIALERLIGEVAELCVPGGLLVLGVLRNCDGYCVGKQIVPTVRVDEEFVSAALTKFSLVPIDLQTLPADGKDGYDGMIILGAQRGLSTQSKSTARTRSRNA